MLRVQPEDATWFNLYRPLIADRELRLILWADGGAADALQRQAVDFVDWIARVVEAPPASPPGFGVEDLRAALDAGGELIWRGPLLEETLRGAGWEAGTVELDAGMDPAAMRSVLARQGLPVLSGISDERDAAGMRRALADLGRSRCWVARNPIGELAGAWSLGPRQLDGEEAARALRDAGRPHPALLAAWLELAPARLEAALRGDLRLAAARLVPPA